MLDQDVHSWETGDAATYQRLHTGNFLSVGINGSVDVGAGAVRKLASNWAEARAAGMVTRFASHARRIVLAPDGTLAWASQEFDVDVSVGAQEGHQAIRRTRILVRKGRAWRIADDQVSVPQSADDLAQSTLAAPSGVQPIPLRIGAGAAPAADALRQALGSRRSLCAAVRPDVDAILPGQAHILHGASALCAFLRDHPATKASMMPGAIVGELSAGGHAAWLGADLTLRLEDPEGDQYLPLRVAAVLVEAAGVWQIALLHATPVLPGTLHMTAQ